MEYYVVGSKIDNCVGKHGEIRKCKNKMTGDIKEVQIVNKKQLTEEEKETFVQQLDQIKMIQNLKIIELLEVYEDYHRWYLVTELEPENIHFFDRIAKMDEFGEKDVAQIIEQLL